MNSIVENIPAEYCLDKKVKEEFKDQDCLFNFFKNFSGDDKVIAFVLTDHFALNGIIFCEEFNHLILTAQLLLLLEAVNCAAKQSNAQYYGIKDLLVKRLLKRNDVIVYCEETWGCVNVNFYHKQVGAVNVHCPDKELSEIIPVRQGLKKWGWAGLCRQPYAFYILESIDAIKVVAEATRPTSDINMNARKQARNRAQKLLTKISSAPLNLKLPVNIELWDEDN